MENTQEQLQGCNIRVDTDTYVKTIRIILFMFSVWKSNLTLSFVAASSEPLYSDIKDKKTLTEIKLKYITASTTFIPYSVLYTVLF